ncbi:High-affinity branched-chain amino acid transport ATP-binding protein [Herminiimonas arsenicoxydans]|uniref:High-affinity branched-chain amino acid transport ATP-binding protein n=1 Tax=Herminiimonas arsenicoxydans TaxID=204773 RepID=A4G8G4_HERAR|nr:High-affinity branched-chain amino acid transport ATP-binding protein [Herminiimonas arsenicoxydans]
MSAPLLKVENLCVNYGHIEAARGISIEVGEGEFVGMIGSNGAGKSSALKAIAGVVKPASGSITLGGKPVQGLASHEMVHQGVALVPEGRFVFADQSVEDNLILGGFVQAQRSGVAALRDDIDRMFQLFPRLKERRTQQAGSLSGGEQQMLVIARGLMSHPRLLLIDEVSLGLAPKILDFLFPVLVDLNRQGLSILLVEQIATRALAVTSRAYVMENGNVKISGRSSDLVKDAAVMEAYLGKQH